MEDIKDDKAAIEAYGIAQATEMCRTILASGLGINGLHFYTLNAEKTTFSIMSNLGLLKPEDVAPLAPDTENTLTGTHIA